MTWDPFSTTVAKEGPSFGVKGCFNFTSNQWLDDPTEHFLVELRWGGRTKDNKENQHMLCQLTGFWSNFFSTTEKKPPWSWLSLPVISIKKKKIPKIVLEWKKVSSVTNWTLDTDCSVSGLFPFSLTPPSWPPFLRSLFQTEKGKCTLYFSLHFLFLSLTSSRIFFLWIITVELSLSSRTGCCATKFLDFYIDMQCRMHTEANNNFTCLTLPKIVKIMLR